MIQAEKLKALAFKAIENGYKPELQFGASDGVAVIQPFDYSLAKALFGEKREDVQLTDGRLLRFGPTEMGELNHFVLPAYQKHMLLALISGHPVDYMYKEVFGDDHK